MKIILLSVCMMLCTRLFSQCDEPNFQASMSVGASKAGYHQTMALGHGSVVDNLGIFAGVKLASEMDRASKKSLASQTPSPTLDPYILFSYRTLNIQEKYYLYNTISFSLAGDLSTSVRCCYRVGWKSVLGIEPFYGLRTGVGACLVMIEKITRE